MRIQTLGIVDFDQVNNVELVGYVGTARIWRAFTGADEASDLFIDAGEFATRVGSSTKAEAIADAARRLAEIAIVEPSPETIFAALVTTHRDLWVRPGRIPYQCSRFAIVLLGIASEDEWNERRARDQGDRAVDEEKRLAEVAAREVAKAEGHKAAMAEVLRKMQAGESVDGVDVLALARHLDIPVNPRTAGTLKKLQAMAHSPTTKQTQCWRPASVRSVDGACAAFVDILAEVASRATDAIETARQQAAGFDASALFRPRSKDHV